MPYKTFSPSATALVLANLVPVIGVLFWDWKVFDILAVFWLENVIIGFVNILRMGTRLVLLKDISAIFTAPFFCVHYGLFTYVHGVFLMSFFGDKVKSGGPAELIMHVVERGGLFWAAAGLLASHLVSFAVNFVLRKEYERVTTKELMATPYLRVIVMHMTVLLGGWIVLVTEETLWTLAPLVLIKIAVDLRAHMAERRQKPVSPGQGAAL